MKNLENIKADAEESIKKRLKNALADAEITGPIHFYKNDKLVNDFSKNLPDAFKVNIKFGSFTGIFSGFLNLKWTIYESISITNKPKESD